MAEINPSVATDEDFATAELACESTGDSWTEICQRGQLRVEQKSTDNASVKVVRVTYDFPDVEPETLYDTLHDHYFRPEWDEAMLEGSLIEQVDGFNEVGYYAVRLPLPLANRDFCNHRAWRVFPGRRGWLIFNRSVKHPGCPQRSRFVRGWSYLTVYLLRPGEGGGARVVYFSQMDPRGWLPVWAINWAMTIFVPKTVSKLHAAALRYPAWKRDHRPDWKPWLLGYDPREKPYARYVAGR